MSVVQLSYTTLLGQITNSLGVEAPDCIVTVAADGWFIAYVDLTIARGGSAIEVARNWGSPCTDYIAAKEDAARVAIQRLKDELGLHIKDANYDDLILYKNLYETATLQLASLSYEQNFIKDCYAIAVSKKVDAINEQIRLRYELNDCHATIASLRTAQPPLPPGPSDVGSAS